jgi:hypothetical protein
MITKLTREQVALVIKTTADTVEAIDTLYRLVVPNYDNLLTVKNPQANRATNEAICQMIIDRDKELNVKHMKGGNWLNYGFCTVKDLEDWEVRYK